MRWSRAAFVAACASRSLPDVLHGVRQMLALWRWMMFGQREPMWRQRLKHGCGRCRIFCRRTGTCGHAGKGMEHPITGERIEQEGCLCLMSLKAQMPQAQCWMAEITEGEIDYWKTLLPLDRVQICVACLFVFSVAGA